MFWSEQAVVTVSDQPHIINKKALENNKWIPPEGYKFVSLTNKEIVEFIRKNNIGGDTTTLLLEQFLQWLRQWPSESIGIKNENNELIAFNFTIFF